VYRFLDPFAGAGAMAEWVQFLATGVPLTVLAWAAVRRAKAAILSAEAEKIWAQRIDPMNPHFRQPLIGRKE
jgi:hypothetical protein